MRTTIILADLVFAGDEDGPGLGSREVGHNEAVKAV